MVVRTAGFRKGEQLPCGKWECGEIVACPEKMRLGRRDGPRKGKGAHNGGKSGYRMIGIGLQCCVDGLVDPPGLGLASAVVGQSAAIE
jgi:hypothetical protein